MKMVGTQTKKIVKLEDILAINKNTEEKDDVKSQPKIEKKTKTESSVIKGKPKSGRVWKNERKRFSSIIKTRGIRNSFEKKEILRKDLARVKESTKARKAEKAEEKESKKERRRENLRRQEVNRKRSEIVQVITNTNKIKNMKKKHLRFIEKRDTTKIQK